MVTQHHVRGKFCSQDGLQESPAYERRTQEGQLTLVCASTTPSVQACSVNG